MIVDNPSNPQVVIYVYSKHPLVLHMLEDLLSCTLCYTVKVLPPGKLVVGWEDRERVLIVDALSVNLWPEYVYKARFHIERIILLQTPELHTLSEELQSLLLGISGIVYMLPSMQKELPKAIESVRQGRFWVGRHALAEFIKKINPTSHKDSSSSNDLTVREEQVLCLLNKGFSNRQIASALNISERTVKFHVSNILHKRKLKNRRTLIYKSESSQVPIGTNIDETSKTEVA